MQQYTATCRHHGLLKGIFYCIFIELYCGILYSSSCIPGILITVVGVCVLYFTVCRFGARAALRNMPLDIPTNCAAVGALGQSIPVTTPRLS